MARFTFTILGVLFFGLAVHTLLRSLALRRPLHLDPSKFFTQPFEIVAHRGGSLEAPENTVEAFSHATSLGPNVVLEMDLHQTKDGEIVVIHDFTLERTTNGQGGVREFSFAELQELDAGFSFKNERGEFPFRGKGVRIPKFSEVLRLFPNTRIVAEVKDADYEIENKIVDIIKNARADDRVMLGSQNSQLLTRLQKAAPSMNFCASKDEILRMIMLIAMYLETTASIETNAYLIPERDGAIPVFSERLSAELHRRGKKVLIWTVNEESDMRRLIAQGVDGLISDRPSLLYKVSKGQ